MKYAENLDGLHGFESVDQCAGEHRFKRHRGESRAYRKEEQHADKSEAQDAYDHKKGKKAFGDLHKNTQRLGHNHGEDLHAESDVSDDASTLGKHPTPEKATHSAGTEASSTTPQEEKGGKEEKGGGGR